MKIQNVQNTKQSFGKVKIVDEQKFFSVLKSNKAFDNFMEILPTLKDMSQDVFLKLSLGKASIGGKQLDEVCFDVEHRNSIVRVLSNLLESNLYKKMFQKKESVVLTAKTQPTDYVISTLRAVRQFNAEI